MLREIVEFIAVLACALFTGAAIYITFVEHPARMHCGVEIAATEFPPSYRRATVMQATCAAVGLLASVAAWLARATVWWLVAGLLDRRSAEAEHLLTRWGMLHAVRSVLSGLALLLFLYLVILHKAA